MSPRAAGLALAAAVLFAGGAPAADAPPTVDELVERYVAAHGGLAAWDTLETLEVTGTYNAYSEQEPFRIVRRRPNGWRFETRMLKRPVVRVWEGDRGWVDDPVESAEWPVDMHPAEAAMARSLADFDSPLVRWREKGHTLTLAGREEVDGVACWRLELTRADGGVETWFLDAATHLEFARDAPASDWGVAGVQRIYFSDFRDVAGVKLPFHVEAEYMTRYHIAAIDRIVANPPVDPGLFVRPDFPEASRLAPMAGSFKITAESRPFPRAPWQSAEGTATLVPAAGGAALEERASYPVLGRPLEVVRMWSWDRFQKLYRLAQADAFLRHFAVYEGPLPGDDGRLALTNLETRSAYVLAGQTTHGRWVLHDIGADGFQVDYEESTDAGANWVPQVKLTYQRQ